MFESLTKRAGVEGVDAKTSHASFQPVSLFSLGSPWEDIASFDAAYCAAQIHEPKKDDPMARRLCDG